MSAEQPPDSPEPEDARDEAASAGGEDAAQPAAGGAPQDVDELEGAEMRQADAGGDTQDAVVGADAEAVQDAEAGEDAGAAAPGGRQADAKKRRRTPRIRKGAAGKADDQQADKEQPRTRAGRGKAAAPKAEAESAAKPAPAPARKKPSSSRPRRRVVRARARYVRTSARKARLVCGHLQGKSVAQARAILAFTPRAVARDWSKLLESAVANAENNHELLEEDLIIREAYADEGPTIKRFRPRAMGRATPIRKRTSHLTITLQTSSSQDNKKRAG
jgi:ribosomal protein L22